MTAAPLKGRTLFITGASRGIGKAIALRAGRDGANVVVAAKTVQSHPTLPGTIHTAVAAIEAAGGKALAVPTDIRFEDQVQAAVQKSVKHFVGASNQRFLAQTDSAPLVIPSMRPTRCMSVICRCSGAFKAD